MTRTTRHPGLPRMVTDFPSLIIKSTPFHFQQCVSVWMINCIATLLTEMGVLTKYLSNSLNSSEAASPHTPKGKTVPVQRFSDFILQTGIQVNFLNVHRMLLTLTLGTGI